MTEYDAVDLFCGAGGFSSGLGQADINVKYGVDQNEDALKTFDKNHEGEAIQHDIREGIPEELQEENFDIVFGSPPCKGFSIAQGGNRYLDDERNGLVFEFIAWVEEMAPDIVLMENVTGMETISDDFMSAVEREYRDAGYDQFTYETLRASDYGVPQNRDRVIVMASHERNDIPVSFPEPTHVEDGQDLGLNSDFDVASLNHKVTVKEAIGDLPNPTEDGIVSLPPLSELDFDTSFLEYVRADDNKTYNHIANQPSQSGHTPKIVSELEPGEMYRSTRFGDRYRQVWDLLSDEFSEAKQEVLRFIGRHRTRKEYRIKGKSVGHVHDKKIVDEVDIDEDAIEDALEELLENGWLREDTVEDKHGYDLNTQSGVRPRYVRIEPDGQSNTILTTDFNPRDKLHPFENRGLSLREGARVQSFPDDFRFHGSFDDIATQIGNAVPPLMAKEIGHHVTKRLE